jgi:hypothetical protein
MLGEQKVNMLFNENRIGKISIDDNVTKNILTKYISKLNNGELINIDIKADQNEVFFFYFKYAQNMTSSFLTDT